MMDVILWAHRQRLSKSQTHKAPAAAVPCVGGDRREQHTINAPRPSPFARLRRTKPTFTKIAPPNRLQPKLPLQLQPRSMPPLTGYPVPAGGHGRPRQQLYRHQPDSLPNFAPPSSTLNKMRPAMPAPWQKTSTLRRARCFGFGRFVALQRSANGRRWPLRQYLPPLRGRPLTSHQPPVPKALRPPLHLSKRYAASVGQLPQMRDSVRPLSVKMPQLPPVGRVNAGGAARVGYGSKYKSQGKGFSRDVRTIR